MSKEVQQTFNLTIKFGRKDGQDINEERGLILMDYARKHILGMIITDSAFENGTLECISLGVEYVGEWMLEDPITFK